jgi:hypothetical protein
LLPALYLLGRDRLSMMAPWRGRAILALRLASVAAIVLALAGPSLPLKDAAMSVAFAVDSSASLSPSTQGQEADWVKQAIGRMRSTDKAAIVRFAGEPQVAKPLGSEKEYQLPPAGQMKGGSDVSAALRMAAGLLPSSGLRKVVLLSDGWDTSGKLEETARTLPEGVRVDVVPWPAMDGQPEVLIESMDVPSYVREGDGFDVSAVVGSNHEGAAKLQVLVDGKPSGSWDVQLGKGQIWSRCPRSLFPWASTRWRSSCPPTATQYRQTTGRSGRWW